MMEKNFFTVLLSFLKVGLIGFGGGTALVPVIENELVEKKKWIDAKSFDQAVAVSSISPASIPVALCSIWDMKYSLLSAYAYALPGPLIYLILLTSFSLIGAAGMQYIGYASVGLISFVLFILYRFVGKNYTNCMRSVESKAPYLIAIGLSFLFTCGGALKRLLVSLLGLPANSWPAFIYSINMINLMFITFFVICFIGSSKSKIKLGTAVLVAALYALSIGNFAVINSWSLYVGIGMVILAVGSICYDVLLNRKEIRYEERPKIKLETKPFKNLALFAILSVTLITAVFFVSRDIGVWNFSGKVVSSSLTAFGGGEAYYAISEHVFVDSGITPRDFYDTQVVGVAGAMPGPVLVSLATGIGYGYGDSLGGAGLGWMFGLLGFALSVAATALGALTLFVFFEAMRDNARVQMIIKYIIPVICGMLISTAISLMSQASLVLVREGVRPVLSLGIVISILIIMMVLNKKYQIKDVVLLLMGGVGTLTTLSAVNYLLA